MSSNLNNQHARNLFTSSTTKRRGEIYSGSNSHHSDYIVIEKIQELEAEKRALINENENIKLQLSDMTR